MRFLNLVNEKESDIKYKISPFPDGQQQVTIESWLGNDSIEKTEPIHIKSRLNNFKDLELIVCANQSLKNLYIKNIHLYVPYFLGSRSDRQFEKGSNNYLKQVICPIINLQNFASVTVLDPHSYVLEACLNNFKKVDNHQLVKWALEQINNKNDAQEQTIFMSPDAGALTKIYKVAEYVNFKGTIINCSKIRENGKIIKTDVPFFDLTKDVVLIDDLCDGAKTFTEIGKIIQQRRLNANPEATGKTFLIVTHGIFSKGFQELFTYFDKVFCTNSYSDVTMGNFTNGKDFVKQLNIF